MVKIRVKVVPPDEDNNSFHVHLPTYMVVAGTEEYRDNKVVSVEVIVPDDECKDGKPDKAKIRAKYKGQPRWDREDILGDI